MGRQSCDAGVIHSSIALLQERFRQLQRAKEMREAQELLRRLLTEPERVNPLLTEPERVNPAAHYGATRLIYNSELIRSPSPLPQGSLYLHPNFNSKHTDIHVTEIPFLANLGLTDSVMDRTNSFVDSDVDTSLHL